MRLIDADALKKKICERYPHFIDRLALSEVFYAIQNASSIDAVPVIRCKDCRYWDEEERPDGRRYCIILDCWLEPEFYCTYGEREEE